MTDKLYVDLQKNNIEVLCDDRDTRAGEKFADSDLLGIPLRLIVSDKNLEKGEIEVKERTGGKVSMLKESEVVDFVKKFK